VTCINKSRYDRTKKCIIDTRCWNEYWNQERFWKEKARTPVLAFNRRECWQRGWCWVDFRDDAKPPVSATATRHAVSPMSFFPFSHYVILLISRYHDNQHTLQDTACHAGIIWHQVHQHSACKCLYRNSMGGDGAWDSRMSDMLKNFDLNSNEVKQQFGVSTDKVLWLTCESSLLVLDIISTTTFCGVKICSIILKDIVISHLSVHVASLWVRNWLSGHDVVNVPGGNWRTDR
jgi:hypothetical protein